MKTIITYGTFDLFHYGHLEFLRRAKGLGEKLIVGIATDEIAKDCTIPLAQRIAIVSQCSFVDHVFEYKAEDQKAEDIKNFKADMLIMGDDWAGKLNDLQGICTVIYLPRTPDISATEIKKTIKGDLPARLEASQRYGQERDGMIRDRDVTIGKLQVERTGCDVAISKYKTDIKDRDDKIVALSNEIVVLKKPKK